MHLDRKEVAEIIQDFLDHRGGAWDWDDFTSIPLDDPELDKLRIECLFLRDKFPPTEKREYCGEAGYEFLRDTVAKLRS